MYVHVGPPGVGVINSPRTSHSLSAVGVDAVAEAALPVALRVSRVSASVLTRSGAAAAAPTMGWYVSRCRNVWYKRH